VWTDGTGAVTFRAFGPDNAYLGQIGPVTIADDMHNGQTAEDRFFGVIDASGIAMINISNSGGGGIEVDHVQFSFAPAACATSFDLYPDGHVNAADITELLGAWGPCPQRGCCDADLDGDGVVDAADLALLLGAWTG
jgi:hypothetical protein